MLSDIAFQVIASDPDRYMIVKVCVILGLGEKFQNVEIDVRPGVVLTKEELNVIQDKLEEGGYKSSLMNQIRYEDCSYSF